MKRRLAAAAATARTKNSTHHSGCHPTRRFELPQSRWFHGSSWYDAANGPLVSCASKRAAPPPRIEAPKNRYRDRRFVTAKATDASASQPRRQKRKKKALVSSPSTKRITTKDRLRLSARPSVGTSSKHETTIDSFIDAIDANRIVVKSPEELVDRLNSGLDIARAAVQETYTSLRNPAAASAGGSGSSSSGRSFHRNGIVMDANWWFWNLVLASSPAILIALYCELVVKPRMREANEERKTGETVGTLGGGEGGIATSDEQGDTRKMSSMRQRQEEQMRGLLQEQDASKDSSSPTPIGSANNNRSTLDETVSLASLYKSVRSLVSLFTAPQLTSTPSPEHAHDHGAGKGVGVQSSTNNEQKISPPTQRHVVDREQQQTDNRKPQLEKQQREINELQSRVSLLKKQIEQQQQHREQTLQATEDHAPADPNDNDKRVKSRDDPIPVPAKTKIPDGNFLVSLTKTTVAATTAGLAAGRNLWGSLQSWRQGRERASHDPMQRMVDANKEEEKAPTASAD